jgi:hypothetical protein
MQLVMPLSYGGITKINDSLAKSLNAITSPLGNSSSQKIRNNTLMVWFQ